MLPWEYLALGSVLLSTGCGVLASAGYACSLGAKRRKATRWADPDDVGPGMANRMARRAVLYGLTRPYSDGRH